MKNADKIRNMTNKELAIKIAEFIGGWDVEDCDKCPATEICGGEDGKTCEEDVYDWLNQEADQ